MGPIGIFDSGFGGLTVFQAIEELMPEYDYLYLGDNARVPYGNKSDEIVLKYTYECVESLFKQNCHLVIIACNTASARALKKIQQEILPKTYPDRRVLGVIRPTSETIGNYSKNGHIGVLATSGTVLSNAFQTEIIRFHPDFKVSQQACPIWVPLIESGDLGSPAMRYYTKLYVEKLFDQDPELDTVVLGCTHYPLIKELIKEFLPPEVTLLPQGELVATSLKDYLNRHPEIDMHCSKKASRKFLTTDDAENFAEKSALFFGSPLHAVQFNLDV